MSHMADAYAFRSLWDLRIYTLKLWLYTGVGITSAVFATSGLEYLFDFSLVGWLLGL